MVPSRKTKLPLKDVVLLPPITKPDKLACVGMNYKSYCQELKVASPQEPIIFSKFVSCIVGPNDNVVLPEISNVSTIPTNPGFTTVAVF